MDFTIDGVKIYRLAVVQSSKVQVFKVKLEREPSTLRELSKRGNVGGTRNQGAASEVEPLA